MRLGELRNMWLPLWWHSRHSRCDLVRRDCLLIFWVLRWRRLLHWDHGQSLGHGHGRVGVGVEEFFVERREEDVDCFRVELLEGLELLGMERAQGWQRWDSADQLPDKRESQGQDNLDWWTTNRENVRRGLFVQESSFLCFVPRGQRSFCLRLTRLFLQPKDCASGATLIWLMLLQSLGLP